MASMERLSFWCFVLLAPLGGCDCSGDEDDEGSGAGTSTESTGADAQGSTGNGFTTSTGTGQGTGSGGGACGTTLIGTIRDFQASHPDFEDFLGTDPGIVASQLGADGKPVYAGQPTTPTTTGQANFDQWFRDVPGVNQSVALPLELTDAGGSVYTFSDSDFFPIDGQLFGDEGNTHNYHFTYELKTKFLYSGGETFSFTGDDDLFTFINGRLAIDLGGVHGALSATIDLDARAAELGITPGNVYSLDFFFAERHTSESNFRIDTTLVFVDCGEPPE
jgi:fibro-slime domain-containing protein